MIIDNIIITNIINNMPMIHHSNNINNIIKIIKDSLKSITKNIIIINTSIKIKTITLIINNFMLNKMKIRL
jgi:hypothetical protein